MTLLTPTHWQERSAIKACCDRAKASTRVVFVFLPSSLTGQVGVLMTAAPGLRSDVNNLLSRTAVLETTSAVVVTNLTTARATLALTDPRSVSNTNRIVALETAGDFNVLRYN